MNSFAGFPTGKNPYVPIPEIFFSHILPDIEDVTELKVTLHLFWRLANRQGNQRFISDRELRADRLLLQGLQRRGDPRSAEDLLRQGLEKAVARGTLLVVSMHVTDGGQGNGMLNWYFFNTPRSRKIVLELQGGEMIAGSLLNKEDAPVEQQSEQPVAAGVYATIRKYDPGQNVQVEVARPNIFTLYEQNIGLLAPLIADELRDAADHFPSEWIEDAFRLAVQYNKRHWSYIRAILRRWETEGRQ